MATRGWTKRWNAGAALVAVAVLLVHALVMGWHVPPQARALAALDASLCHAAAPEDQDHGSPGEPASPSDRLAHCPICLSGDGGKLLGAAAGPALPAPTRLAALAFAPADTPAPATPATTAFSARAPPAAV